MPPPGPGGIGSGLLPMFSKVSSPEGVSAAAAVGVWEPVAARERRARRSQPAAHGEEAGCTGQLPTLPALSLTLHPSVEVLV